MLLTKNTKKIPSNPRHSQTKSHKTFNQMGCVSSKLVKKDLKREILLNARGDYAHHVVSLTSSTYGALKLDKDPPQPPPIDQKKKSPPRRSLSCKEEQPPEIINAWELMEDLEEEVVPISVSARRSPKFLRGFVEIDVKTPLKLLNQMGVSPRKLKRFSGKENKRVGLGRLDYSPKTTTILKASTLPPNLRISKNGSPGDVKKDGLRIDLGLGSTRRRSLGPLFDPDNVDSVGKDLCQEREQIKKMVSGTPISRKSRNSKEGKGILESFETKCPPGGENAVVIYTTTLRGIRKTFEDCNIVRSIIESHHVRMIERDVSMDSGFKEELRKLMGKKEVKVPVVLVKGRLIGGSDEIVKLEEEGKLGILLDGIPRVAVSGCEGCAGVRFVMCTVCNGSCKLMGADGRKSIKCGECNENGLVQCPICS